MASILVSHPQATAFAVGLATALDRAGSLASFATGTAASSRAPAGRLLRRLATRYPVAHRRVLEIAPEHIASRALPELGARAIAPALARFGADVNVYDAMYVAHDASVAAMMRWPRGLDAVYGYEDAALWTFRRARRRGVACVWDLPLPHHDTLASILEAEAKRWPDAASSVAQKMPAWKRGRKNEELRLASLVVAASSFTRRSLERLDVRAPIVTIPYGFPIESFAPKRAPSAGPFTVLAVGFHELRKGTPYLLEAWRRADLRDARLRLIGQMHLPAAFLAPYAGLFEHVRHIPNALLGDEYRGADMLAFPTLGDGFGVVMQEAMCCGTPVAATRASGAPECIRHGQDGWILPERDVDTLVEHLRWAAAHRDELFRIGQRARARAEELTWDAAAATLSSAIASLLSPGEHRSSPTRSAYATVAP